MKEVIKRWNQQWNDGKKKDNIQIIHLGLPTETIAVKDCAVCIKGFKMNGHFSPVSNAWPNWYKRKIKKREKKTKG